MFSFCPHCGETIGQEQVAGRTLVCKHCGQKIGQVSDPAKPVIVDQAKELIRLGRAAPCPLCRQLVELKGQPGSWSLVPHLAAGSRKMCPGSGKPIAGAAQEQTAANAPASAGDPALLSRITSTGKDLSAHIQREVIRVVLCRKDAATTIEELTLEYLDKSDRVRLQIESLREILGPAFRMKAYPAALKKPHLSVWGSATACVIARKHDQGGYQPLADAELKQVLKDVQQHQGLFFS